MVILAGSNFGGMNLREELCVKVLFSEGVVE